VRQPVPQQDQGRPWGGVSGVLLRGLVADVHARVGAREPGDALQGPRVPQAAQGFHRFVLQLGVGVVEHHVLEHGRGAVRVADVAEALDGLAAHVGRRVVASDIEQHRKGARIPQTPEGFDRLALYMMIAITPHHGRQRGQGDGGRGILAQCLNGLGPHVAQRMRPGDVDDRRHAPAVRQLAQSLDGLALDVHVGIGARDRHELGEGPLVPAAAERVDQDALAPMALVPSRGRRDVVEIRDRRRIAFAREPRAADHQRDRQRNRERAGDPARENLRGHGRHEAADPPNEGAARGRERQGRQRVAQPLHPEQRGGVEVGVPADGDRHVVAAVLTLLAHPSRRPPDRRVVEQQRLDRRLQQIHEVVVPPDMRQLVGEQRVELQGRQPDQGARRQQDHRTQPADHGRHLHDRGLEHADGTRDPQPGRQASHRGPTGLGDRPRAHPAESLGDRPPGHEPQRQDHHAG